MHASLIKTLVLLCLFFVVVVGWVFPQPGRSQPSVTAKLGFPADPTSRWGGSESSPALSPPRGQTRAVVLGGFGLFCPGGKAWAGWGSAGASRTQREQRSRGEREL